MKTKNFYNYNVQTTSVLNFKKWIFFLLFLLAPFLNFGQSSSQILIGRFNAGSNDGYGFSCNVQIEISKSIIGKKLIFKSKLLSVQIADNKGWYDNSRTKYHSCDILGNYCAIFTQFIDVRIEYGMLPFDLNSFSYVGQELVLYDSDIDIFKKVVGSDAYTFKVPAISQVIITHKRDAPVWNILRNIGSTENANNKSTSNNTNPLSNSTTTTTNTKNNQTTTTYKQPTQIDPNDPNPMTNGLADNYQPKSSSSNDKFTRDVQMATEIMYAAAPLIQGWVDQRNKRNESIAAYQQSNIKKRSDDYLIYSQTLNRSRETFSKWEYFRNQYINKLPNVLEKASPSWRKIINFQDPSREIFGIEASELIENKFFVNQVDYKVTIKGFKKFISGKKSQSDINRTKRIPSINGISAIDGYEYYFTYKIRFNVKGSYKNTFANVIFNKEHNVIGLRLDLRDYNWSKPTDYQNYDYNDPLELKDFIISQLGDNFVQTDLYTYFYKDKLVYIDQGFNNDGGSYGTELNLYLFDLNALSDQVIISFPEEYAKIKSYSNGKIDYPSIGIGYKLYNQVKDNSETLRQFKKMAAKGCVVNSVPEGYPASKAGIRPNDIITKINGIEINGAYMLEWAVHAYAANKKYDVTYLRDGTEYQTTILLY